MNKIITDYIYRTNFWLDDRSFRYDSIERDFYLRKISRESDKLIDILTGARRAGKTYILYSVINKLLDNDIDCKKILYLTGDSREVKKFGLKAIIEEYINLMKFNYRTKLFIFIDEVQEIKEWQNDIKFYYDSAFFKFYLTGSTGVILDEKTSKLTGRFIRTNVLPLSFSEYLIFTGARIASGGAKKNIELFEEYLKTGGYPEYVLKRNEDYLRQVISSSLYRDLLSYYGIRNPAFLGELLNYLVDKICNPVSLLRIKNDLKVDYKTAKFYLKYLQDIFLVYPVYKSGRSYKITKSSNPKYYLNDTGVINLLSISPKIGALAENAVFLKFMRVSKWVDNPPIYYNQESGIEIDFLVENRNYEVKYRNNYEEIGLSDYNDLIKNITVIVPQKKKAMIEKYPNIDFTESWDFCS